MQKIFAWIKNNKLSSVLIVILFLFIFRAVRYLPVFTNGVSYRTGSTVDYTGGEAEMIAPSSNLFSSKMSPKQSVPQMGITERKVVTESTTSLVVKDVNASLKTIKKEAETAGGYMVNMNFSSPEGAASGNISVRIPSDKMDSFLDYLKANSVRVVSMRIKGHDVTDKYVDIKGRVAILKNTKATFTAILEKATNVDEIMMVQERILGIQDQIDSYTGQLLLLDATSKSSLIEIYLATDEYSLPFTPDKPWTPKNTFKLAVRSMVKTARGAADIAIWAAVYAVLIVPVIIIFKVIKKALRKRSQQS